MRRPASSACHQPALALHAVRDVLVELGGSVEHDRPVPGADDLDPEHPQPPQRAEVAAQRAGVGIDEDRALAQDGVAREADAARDVGEVVGRVAGRGDGAQWAELLAVLDAHVGALVARGRHGHAARAPAQLVDGLDVVEVVVRHGDAADPAAVARVGERRARGGPRMSGPGSMT